MFATPLPKPTTATGVSRSVVVPSPTCRNHLFRSTMSPHAHPTPSRASGCNYLAIAIVTPTRDRPTAENRTRMPLQTIHETHIAPPLITPQTHPKHSGQSTTGTSPDRKPSSPQQPKTAHTTTTTTSTAQRQATQKTRMPSFQKNYRTSPKAMFATPLPKPTTATGVSRLVPEVPSPTCRHHLLSSTIFAHAHPTPRKQAAAITWP